MIMMANGSDAGSQLQVWVVVGIALVVVGAFSLSPKSFSHLLLLLSSLCSDTKQHCG